jgi:uroporphyrinogen-III synthase
MSGNASASAPLRGHNIWLTRPAAQVTGLQGQLQQAGAAVFCLPLLVIAPLVPTGINKQRLLDLDRYDLVFFVSSNAASIGLEAINDYWPQYPRHIQNFAVGPGTAAVLQGYGLDVAWPTERMSSEAMLALPQLQAIAGKKALIVRGVGGREILAEGLLARGASVDYVELYERKQPVYAADYLRQQYQQQTPAAVVVSSAEALDNLYGFFAPLGLWPLLPLFVSSDRLAEHAHKLGNNQTCVMAGASDAAIIAGLTHFLPAVSV